MAHLIQCLFILLAPLLPPPLTPPIFPLSLSATRSPHRFPHGMVVSVSPTHLCLISRLFSPRRPAKPTLLLTTLPPPPCRIPTSASLNRSSTDGVQCRIFDQRQQDGRAYLWRWREARRVETGIRWCKDQCLLRLPHDLMERRPQLLPPSPLPCPVCLLFLVSLALLPSLLQR